MLPVCYAPDFPAQRADLISSLDRKVGDNFGLYRKFITFASMVRTIRLLLMLAIALITIQCDRHHYSPKLTLLDSLADTKVDSAVILMRRIAPQFADASEWDRRYYQLLSIKIADKADLPLPSDTIAWELVRYYEEEGDERLLPLAYYYGARICRSHNDAPQALDYLLKANDLLPDNRQLRLKAVVNSQMGYLFSQQKLYRNAIEAFKRAYYCDSIIRDTTGLIYNLRDMGFDYENVGIRDSSIFFFQKAILLASVQKNVEMIFTMKTHIASLYHLLGRNDEALTLIKEVITYNDKSSQSATFSVAADIYQALGMTDSAVVCYQRLINLPFIYAQRKGYGGLSGYYANNEMHKQAHFYYEKYRMCSDSIDKITATNAIAQMNSLYNYQLREKENEQLKNENEAQSKTIRTIGFTTMTFVLALIIMFLYIRHRDLTLKIKLERRQRVKAIIELAAIRPDRQDDNIQIKESESVKDIVRILNDPTNKNKLVSPEEWCKLEECVESFFPSFKDRIVEICKLTDFKLHICLLIKVGFSIAEIALLTQHSAEAVTSARRRMAQKAFGEGSSPAEWDEFIHSL